jgi:hypothetical protein
MTPYPCHLGSMKEYRITHTDGRFFISVVEDAKENVLPTSYPSEEDAGAAIAELECRDEVDACAQRTDQSRGLSASPRQSGKRYSGNLPDC